jgi:hypothetical protein
VARGRIVAGACVFAALAGGVAYGCVVDTSGLTGGGPDAGEEGQPTDVVPGDARDASLADGGVDGPIGDGAGCGDPMNDPKNCGACGRSCLGGACSGGSCPVTVLAPNEDTPRFLAIDDASVYFAQSGQSGHARVVAKDGKGGGHDLAPTPLCLAQGVAVDDVYVSVAANKSGCTGGQIYLFAKDGGAPTVVPATNPIGVAAAGGVAYVTDVGIVRELLEPLVSKTIENGQTNPYAVAFDSTSLYWTELGNGSADGGRLRRAPLGGDGDAGTIVASGLSTPGGIAIGNAIYVSDLSKGILAAPKDGGAPTTLVSMANAFRVATDGAHLYFTTQGGDAVYRANLDGTGLIPIAQGQSLPFDLAVDDSYVYFTNEGLFVDGGVAPGTGSVARTPK